MYQNPKRAKKLYKEIVPKAVDEYLDFIEKAKTQDELQLLMNPVWHVHNSKIPEENMIMSFSMLLNLVETSNANNKNLLWKFVKRYKTNILNGNCKLQWKVDWAMRWFTFDVDFEMYGKDLTESAILTSKICQTQGKNPPNGFAYELY